MASFKQHCAFGFWLASQMKDPDGVLESGERSAMGHLGKITSIRDLPSKKVLAKYIREAMALIDAGAKQVRTVSKRDKADLMIPQFLLSALMKNKKAWSTFDKFNYSHRKEYVEWITEAKTEKTRLERMSKALEWLAEGKSRHWKYAK
jgi:uncharacterized protein YdeI (YjbR/CyaY-like superfamily)